jgi:selenide,water dikinase
MMQLNKVGEALGAISGVHAMTDVTGFGLLGHLIEMAEGSHLSATLNFAKLPLITKGLLHYIQQNTVPGGTIRNWKSYGHKVSFMWDTDSIYERHILADPQTSGGLLIAVDRSGIQKVKEVLIESGLQHFTEHIGWMTAKEHSVVSVTNDHLIWLSKVHSEH